MNHWEQHRSHGGGNRVRAGCEEREGGKPGTILSPHKPYHPSARVGDCSTSIAKGKHISYKALHCLSLPCNLRWPGWWTKSLYLQHLTELDSQGMFININHLSNMFQIPVADSATTWGWEGRGRRDDRLKCWTCRLWDLNEQPPSVTHCRDQPTWGIVIHFCQVIFICSPGA